MHRCRSDILELIPADQAQLVEWLAVPHQSAYAIRKLKQLRSRAVPSLRHGLQHPEHLVRVGCCIALDHVYDDSCLPGLIENLNHPHPDVRRPPAASEQRSAARKGLQAEITLLERCRLAIGH